MPAAALPMVARWDKGGSLLTEAKALVTSLLAKLSDSSQSDETRAQVASSLVGVRQLSSDILPAVGKLLGSSASTSLQRSVIQVLGSSAEPAAVGLFVEAYPRLSQELQDPAFEQSIIARILLLDFGAKDVGETTVDYPILFFPA